MATAKTEKNDGLELFDGLKQTNVSISGMLEKKDGHLITYNRADVKVKLEELVEKHKERLGVLVALETLTTEELDELKGIKKQLMAGRRYVEKIEEHNNPVLNKIKKEQTKLNGELVEVVSIHEDKAEEKIKAEVARIEKEEQDRKDAIEKNAKEAAAEIQTQLANMTFATMDQDEKTLRKFVTDHWGTFEEFDVHFELVADNLDQLILDRRTALDDAEKSRVEKLEQSIKALEVDVKEIVFNATAETIEADDKRISEILGTKDDFQELKGKFEAKAKELKTLWENAKTRINATIQQTAQTTETVSNLENNIYNERAERLVAIGMTQSENGDFQAFDLTYAKRDIINDNAEIWKNTVESIVTFIDLESKKAVETTDVVGEEILGDQPAANFEAEAPAETEPAVPESGNVAATTHTITVQPNYNKFDVPQTLGQLREIFADYSDDTPLKFDNLENIYCRVLDEPNQCIIFKSL